MKRLDYCDTCFDDPAGQRWLCPNRDRHDWIDDYGNIIPKDAGPTLSQSPWIADASSH